MRLLGRGPAELELLQLLLDRQLRLPDDPNAFQLLGPAISHRSACNISDALVQPGFYLTAWSLRSMIGRSRAMVDERRIPI